MAFGSGYLLASPLIADRAGNHGVIDDERAHHASDHLLILATIDLDDRLLDAHRIAKRAATTR